MIAMIVTQLASYRYKEMSFDRENGDKEITKMYLLYCEDADAYRDSDLIKSFYMPEKGVTTQLLDKLVGKKVQLTGILTTNNGELKFKPRLITEHENTDK